MKSIKNLIDAKDGILSMCQQHQFDTIYVYYNNQIGNNPCSRIFSTEEKMKFDSHSKNSDLKK